MTMNKNEANKKGFNLGKLSGITNSFKNTFDKEEDLYEEEIDIDVENSEITSIEKSLPKKNKAADKTLYIFNPKNKEDDVAEIILQLRDGSPCIINVSELSEEESKRVIDNISGAAFALMGSGVPISKGIYAFVPKTFSVRDLNTKEISSKDILLSSVSK